MRAADPHSGTLRRFLSLTITASVVICVVSTTQATQKEKPKQRFKLEPDPDFDPPTPKKGKTPKKGSSMKIDPDPDFDTPKKPTKTPSGTVTFQRALLRGSLVSKFAGDVRIDNQYEQVFKWENRFDLELSYRFKANIKAVVSARLTYWVVGEGNEKERSFWMFNGESFRWEFEPELRDAYLDFRWSWFRLTVGNQTIRWGQTDSLSPLDVINPTDYREGIPTDFKTPLLPIMAVNMQASVKRFNFQLVWVPFFASHKVNLFGSDYAVMQPGSANPLASMITQFQGFLDRSLWDKLQPLMMATRLPDENPKNSSVGFRVTGSLGTFDFGVCYYFGWDRFPKFKADPAVLSLLSAVSKSGFALTPDLLTAFAAIQNKDPQTLINSEYQRMHLVGLDFSWAIDPVTIKADVAFHPYRIHYTTNFEPIAKPTLTYTVGVEWQHKSWLTLSVEFTHMHVFKLEGGQSLSFFDKDMLLLFGMLRMTFLDNDALEIQLTTIFGIKKQDYVIGGQVRYKFTDSWSLAVGVIFFEGPSDSMIGLYNQNDHVYVQGRFAF